MVVLQIGLNFFLAPILVMELLLVDKPAPLLVLELGKLPLLL